MTETPTRSYAQPLALALYALLADAAIETFSSGSPVRWWVLVVVAVYLATSALLWRRDHPAWRGSTWTQRGAASALVLVGLLGITVWLPGGATEGITILRQPTAVWLALTSAGAVGMAGWLLHRSTWIAPIGRGLAVALAAYAIVAFVWAAVERTPYPALLAGESFWTSLPRALQGAFLGLFAIVPAALVVVARSALGRAPARRWAFQGLALLLAIDLVGASSRGLQPAAAGLFAVPDASELASTRAIRSSYPARSALSAREVEEVLRRSDALAASIPALPYEVAARSEALGPELEAAFFFVRDEIDYEAYPGVLRGAPGAYRARAGNAFDRSLLLSELLRSHGVKTRFAMCRLGSDDAERLYERMFAQQLEFETGDASSEPLPQSEFQARLRARAVEDFAALRRALGDEPRTPGRPAREALLAEIQRHVWVQARTDAGWLDLDSSFPDAQVGSRPACSERTADEMPAQAHQMVTIRVVAETLSAGALDRETVLELTRPAVELTDRELFLLHAPGSGEGSLPGAVGGAALGKDAWTPILVVDRQFHAGTAIAFADRQPEERGQPPAGGLEGIFGPGGALAGPERYFVAEWLEFEIRLPDGRRERSRRPLVDRATKTWRNADDRDPTGLRTLARNDDGPIPPQVVHNIWLSAGPHDLRAYAGKLQAAVSWAAGAELPEVGAKVPFREIGWPFAVQNFALLVYSDHVIVPSLNDSPDHLIYAGSPRILIVSAGPDPGEPESDRFEIGFDLRHDDLWGAARTPAGEPGLAERGLWFRALEAALLHETAELYAAAFAGEVTSTWNPSASLPADPEQPASTAAAGLAASVTAQRRSVRLAGFGMAPPVVLAQLPGAGPVPIGPSPTISPPGVPTPQVEVHINPPQTSSASAPTETPQQQRKGGPEYLGVIAGVTIPLVLAVAYVYVPVFREAVLRLGARVEELLAAAAKHPSRRKQRKKPKAVPDPPGDCDPDLHRHLQDLVDFLCKPNPGSCRPGESCAAMHAKLARHAACADARRRINNTCFRGGDRGHQIAHTNRRQQADVCRGLLPSCR